MKNGLKVSKKMRNIKHFPDCVQASILTRCDEAITCFIKKNILRPNLLILGRTEATDIFNSGMLKQYKGCNFIEINVVSHLEATTI